MAFTHFYSHPRGCGRVGSGLEGRGGPSSMHHVGCKDPQKLLSLVSPLGKLSLPLCVAHTHVESQALGGRGKSRVGTA